MKPWQIDLVRVPATWALASMLMVWTGCRSEATAPQQDAAGKDPSTARIEVTSTAFTHGQPIPTKYTAYGEDTSPPLAWSGLPEGTKELALICEDPDAPDPANPRRDPWVHWVVYKIPATAKGLPEAVAREAKPAQPAGIFQGHNSWGSGENVGYRGPEPPIGRHRYFFKLYALDGELDLKPGLDKESLLEAIRGHVLGEGQLMGTYER